MAAPILILSNPRTGSTLLRLLLDTHPFICSPGELALGRLCDMLYTAVEATLGQLGAGETMEARRRRCFAETRRTIDALMQRYCETKGKPRWCEKSTSNVEFLESLHAVFPDAHYLCLHRHALDVVCSSIEMYGASPWQIRSYLERNGGDHVSAWIDRWCDHTEKLVAFEAEHADRAHRVIYEQLVTNPDAVLQSILEFVDVPWVQDLAQKVFAVPHDLGRGDPKVAVSTAIQRDRVGKGRRLDVSGISEGLRDRLRGLLERLGYGSEIGSATSEQRSSRVELTSVSELFDVHFPRQLARHARPTSGRSVLGIVVTGSDGGAWTIHVDGASAHVESGAERAPFAVAFASTDLLDVVNRRISVAEFRNKVGIQGDLHSFDRPMSERLMWMLFADDFRPSIDETTAAITPHH